jgi:site-specific recombinase XerD
VKPTDFSVHVTSFLTHYLAAQRNVSPNTIRAYRDVFTLLLRFCRDVQGIALESLRLEQIDVSLVEAFLDYLERERKSSPQTRNHRLAALHAFFRYIQAEEPARMLQCQKILAIPQRRYARPTVAYLSKEELAEILAQPDLRTPDGRRDAVLLSVLYDTGARVQELVDLSVGDVRLDPPAQLRLLGKGRKMRCTFDGKNGPAPTRSHAGKLPRWSRTVRQTSLPERTQATTVVFGNPLHSSQISRQSTRQASEPEPKSESAHAEAHKRNALVAERNLPRDDPRLPWPRGCQDD